MLVAIFLNRKVQNAYDRLAVAACLEGHIRYWYTSLLRSQLASLLLTAHGVGKDERAAILSGDPSAAAAVRAKIEKTLDEAKAVLAQDHELLDALIKQVKAMSGQEVALVNEAMDRGIASLADGTGFLDVRDATKLDWFIQPLVNEVRGELGNCFTMVKFLVAHARWQETPSEERLAEFTVSLIKSALNAMKHFDTLLGYAQRVRARGVLRNLW